MALSLLTSSEPYSSIVKRIQKVVSNLPAGSSADPSIGFCNDTRSGIHAECTGNTVTAIDFTIGSSDKLQIRTNNQVLARKTASSATPTYSFIGDASTGVTSDIASRVAIVSNGLERASFLFNEFLLTPIGSTGAGGYVQGVGSANDIILTVAGSAGSYLDMRQPLNGTFNLRLQSTAAKPSSIVTKNDLKILSDVGAELFTMALDGSMFFRSQITGALTNPFRFEALNITGAVAGFTTTPTINMRFTKYGNIVVCHLKAQTGTMTAATTIVVTPTAAQFPDFQPIITQTVSTIVIDNAVTLGSGTVVCSSAGTLTFTTGVSTGVFTIASTCGWPQTTFMYSLLGSP